MILTIKLKFTLKQISLQTKVLFKKKLYSRFIQLQKVGVTLTYNVQKVKLGAKKIQISKNYKKNLHS